MIEKKYFVWRDTGGAADEKYVARVFHIFGLTDLYEDRGSTMMVWGD